MTREHRGTTSPGSDEEQPGFLPPARSGPRPAETTQSFNMSGVGRHAAVYAVGVFLERGLGFLMLPFYTRFLTPDDYGVMGLIVMTLDFITILGGAALVNGVFRFYHKAETEVGKNRVVSTAQISILSSYALTSLVCFLAAEHLSVLVFETPDVAWLIRIASAAMFAQALPIVPLGYAQVRDHSRLYVTASAVRLGLALSLNILFLAGLGWGVEAMFWSTLISQGLVGLYLNGKLLGQVGWTFHIKTLRTLLQYSLPIVGTQFASFIYVFADRYVLQRSWGEDTVGVYHVAYRFAVMLPLIASAPIARVWGPKRFEIAKRDDRDYLLSRGLLYQILAVAAGYLGISLFVGDVVRLMTTPEFYGAAAIVPVVMLAYVFNIMAGNQDIGILVSEKTRYLFVIDWIAAGAAMTGFLLLIPSFGLMGAASATVVAYVVRWGLVYLVSQRLWRVNYQWVPILRVALFTAVPLAGAYAVRLENPWVSFASRVGWALVFFGAVWWGGILTERERDWLKAFPGKAYNAVVSRLV